MKSLIWLFLLSLPLVGAMHAADHRILPTDEKISVDFPSESRRTIIRNIADLYGMNIVFPSDLPDEPTPMKLRDVTWQEIFELALVNSGYTFYARTNVVWIVRVGNQQQQIAMLRDKLQTEIEENARFREAIAILIKADAPPLSEELRGEIRTFLTDPNRSADDLLKKLGKVRPNKAPVPTSMPVTPVAYAPVAPATLAAQL